MSGTSREKSSPPPSANAEQILHQPPRPHRPILKTLALVLLSILHLGCNVAILCASFHTYRFGARITKDTWWVSDKNVLTVISVVSKILFTTTTIFGGWTISYLWSRRLSKPGAHAGLAELESLTIFQSVTTIYTAMKHLKHKQYISSQWLYGFVIACAVLLQVYSTAVINLATPALAWIDHPLTSFQYTPIPFMSSPVNQGRCAGISADTARRSCIGVTLSGSSLTDIESFDGSVHWFQTRDTWRVVSTSYVSPNLLTGASLPLGPIDGTDFLSGAALYGVNLATVQTLTNSTTDFGKKVWDSVEFEIIVNTTIPLLLCQCAQAPGGTSNVTIQGANFQLPSAIPSIPSGNIAGQVTTDGMFLIISISGGNSINTNCVIGLSLQNQNVTIIGTPSARSTTTVTNTVAVYPFANDTQALKNAIGLGQGWPIADFANVWLSGLQWNSTPTAAPAVDFLGDLTIGTGNGGTLPSTAPVLEQYVLVMLANGISAGFSAERLDTSASVAPASRVFDYLKAEYYLGVTTGWQYLLVAIILLDTVFVFFCAGTILYGGWYPAWTDPVTLVRVALCSNPPGISTDHTHPDKPTILARSPVSLVHGEDVDERLWKDEYKLVEVISGERNYLVLEVKPVSDDKC